MTELIEVEQSSKTKKMFKKIEKMSYVAMGTALVSMPALADAPDVSEIVSELGLLIGGPILAIGTARATVSVAMRGWKIVGRMI